MYAPRLLAVKLGGLLIAVTAAVFGSPIPHGPFFKGPVGPWGPHPGPHFHGFPPKMHPGFGHPPFGPHFDARRHHYAKKMMGLPRPLHPSHGPVHPMFKPGMAKPHGLPLGPMPSAKRRVIILKRKPAGPMPTQGYFGPHVVSKYGYGSAQGGTPIHTPIYGPMYDWTQLYGRSTGPRGGPGTGGPLFSTHIGGGRNNDFNVHNNDWNNNENNMNGWSRTGNNNNGWGRNGNNNNGRENIGRTIGRSRNGNNNNNGWNNNGNGNSGWNNNGGQMRTGGRLTSANNNRGRVASMRNNLAEFNNEGNNVNFNNARSGGNDGLGRRNSGFNGGNSGSNRRNGRLNGRNGGLKGGNGGLNGGNGGFNRRNGGLNGGNGGLNGGNSGLNGGNGGLNGGNGGLNGGNNGLNGGNGGLNGGNGRLNGGNSGLNGGNGGLNGGNSGLNGGNGGLNGGNGGLNGGNSGLNGGNGGLNGGNGGLNGGNSGLNGGNGRLNGGNDGLNGGNGGLNGRNGGLNGGNGGLNGRNGGLNGRNGGLNGGNGWFNRRNGGSNGKNDDDNSDTQKNNANSRRNNNGQSRNSGRNSASRSRSSNNNGNNNNNRNGGVRKMRRNFGKLRLKETVDTGPGVGLTANGIGSDGKLVGKTIDFTGLNGRKNSEKSPKPSTTKKVPSGKKSGKKAGSGSMKTEEIHTVDPRKVDDPRNVKNKKNIKKDKSPMPIDLTKTIVPTMKPGSWQMNSNLGGSVIDFSGGKSATKPKQMIVPDIVTPGHVQVDKVDIVPLDVVDPSKMAPSHKMGVMEAKPLVTDLGLDVKLASPKKDHKPADVHAHMDAHPQVFPHADAVAAGVSSEFQMLADAGLGDIGAVDVFTLESSHFASLEKALQTGQPLTADVLDMIIGKNATSGLAHDMSLPGTQVIILDGTHMDGIPGVPTTLSDMAHAGKGPIHKDVHGSHGAVPHIPKAESVLKHAHPPHDPVGIVGESVGSIPAAEGSDILGIFSVQPGSLEFPKVPDSVVSIPSSISKMMHMDKSAAHGSHRMHR